MIKPITIPLGVILLAHAWAIPELYASRGARAVRRAAPSARGAAATPGAAADGGGEAFAGAERVALGLLGDLVDHRARDLHAGTGLVVERHRLGIWVLGDAGALLVRRGGHRVDCYCVHVPDRTLPPSDRLAHLLLALRQDEAGFATVANLVFSGAAWRVRRRLPKPTRPALAEAVALAKR